MAYDTIHPAQYKNDWFVPLVSHRLQHLTDNLSRQDRYDLEGKEMSLVNHTQTHQVFYHDESFPHVHVLARANDN